MSVRISNDESIAVYTLHSVKIIDGEFTRKQLIINIFKECLYTTYMHKNNTQNI